MKTAHFVTFGCKVNQYDTQELRARLLERGLAEVPDLARADLVVINSCTVTERGAADARRAVRRAVRANRAARVVVTGCAAEERPDFFRAMPGVAHVVGNADKTRLASLVLDDPSGAPAPAASPFGAGIRRFEGRSRAFLKVQDPGGAAAPRSGRRCRTPDAARRARGWIRSQRGGGRPPRGLRACGSRPDGAPRGDRRRGRVGARRRGQDPPRALTPLKRHFAAYFSAPRKWRDMYGRSPTTQLSCGSGGM